jgi:hypothetical protein
MGISKIKIRKIIFVYIFMDYILLYMYLKIVFLCEPCLMYSCKSVLCAAVN